MELSIKLFATLKDRAGMNRIEVAVDEPATVESVLDVVSAEYPALAIALPSSLVAVNRAFADPQTPVNPGDEVALFPPVSGG
jgi:molybdopterin converting factor subunit 1